MDLPGSDRSHSSSRSAATEAAPLSARPPRHRGDRFIPAEAPLPIGPSSWHLELNGGPNVDRVNGLAVHATHDVEIVGGEERAARNGFTHIVPKTTRAGGYGEALLPAEPREDEPPDHPPQGVGGGGFRHRARTGGAGVARVALRGIVSERRRGALRGAISRRDGPELRIVRDFARLPPDSPTYSRGR